MEHVKLKRFASALKKDPFLDEKSISRVLLPHTVSYWCLLVNAVTAFLIQANLDLVNFLISGKIFTKSRIFTIWRLFKYPNFQVLHCCNASYKTLILCQ